MSIQNKKIFFSIFLISEIFAFFSCTRVAKETSKTEYTKSTLEVAFSQEIEFVPLSYLSSVIGTGSGDTETFGEKKSLLIFFEEEGCTTCEKVKPVVNDWVRLSGCTIYGYRENENSGTKEEKQEFLKKLGSEDGIELTAGRLVAFTEGQRRGALAGTFDLESAQNIDIFARRYFSFPEKDSFLNFDRKKFSSLKELRNAVSKNEKFLLYTERHTCPYCRLLSDPQGFDSLTEIMKNCDISLRKILTEDTLRELYEPVSIKGKKFESVFEYLKFSGSDVIFWPQNDNDKKKAEYLEMLVALKLVAPYPDNDEFFLTSLDDYAKKVASTPEKNFLWSDRIVPSFCFVTDGKIPNLENINENSDSAHIEFFPYYFGEDAEKFDKENYNSLLLDWVKKCLQNIKS